MAQSTNISLFFKRDSLFAQPHMKKKQADLKIFIFMKPKSLLGGFEISHGNYLPSF